MLRIPTILPHALMVLFLLPLGAEGQTHCTDCEIHFEKDVVLDFTDAPASPSFDLMVVELHGGGFAVNGSTTGVEILLFDDDGHFSRAIGTRGEGPGEFGSQPRIGVPMEDGFLAHDPALHRLHFIGNDGVTRWTQRMEMTTSGIFGAGSNLVAAGLAVEDGVAHGLLFAEIDGEGTAGEVRRIRHAVEQAPVQPGERPDWLLVATDPDHVWAMGQSGGTLHMLDPYGRPLGTFDVPLEPIPDDPGPVFVFDIGTGAGLIWIHQVGPAAEGEGATRITVYDPDDRRVATTGWLESLLRPLEMGRAVQVVPEASGELSVTVGDLVLRDRSAETTPSVP